VEVSAGGNLSGKLHASGVDRLEIAGDMDTARDLLDQDRSKPLGPQLLVNAQEVDLNHELLAVYFQRRQRKEKEKNKENKENEQRKDSGERSRGAEGGKSQTDHRCECLPGWQR